MLYEVITSFNQGLTMDSEVDCFTNRQVSGNGVADGVAVIGLLTGSYNFV